VAAETKTADLSISRLSMLSLSFSRVKIVFGTSIARSRAVPQLHER
jgi:hypothetical protein